MAAFHIFNLVRVVASEPNYRTQCWFDARKCWKHVTHTHTQRRDEEREEKWKIERIQLTNPKFTDSIFNWIQFSSIRFCWLELKCQKFPKCTETLHDHGFELHFFLDRTKFIWAWESYIAFGRNRRFQLLNELILSIHWIKGIKKFSSRHIVVRCHHRFVIANQLCAF